MDKINRSAKLKQTFSEWTPEEQENFLDICSGAKGCRILSDSFFKEIMNPETAPARLESFLTLVLTKKVKVLKVLPNDSTRIADEVSLLIMDIVVELGDGSLANVEVQRLGYAFPGQRTGCYSSDLLLRQYKRAKDQKKKKFTYRDIHKVYTIVLFENSPKECKMLKDFYIHRGRTVFDTGLSIELPQEYIYIALDIFKSIGHNKGIRNMLDAWLTFFCEENPETIIKLIQQYPYFKPLYDDIYELCRSTERVMEMYSKELQEIDRNTVQFMIDELQDAVDAQKEQLSQKEEELTQKDRIISQKEEAISQKNEEMKKMQSEIEQLRKLLAEKN